MKPGFILGEVWNGLRRNLSMAISIVLVTMVSMFLFGLGLLAQTQVDTLKGYWYDRIQVSIYLCPDNSGQPNCEGKGVTAAQQAAIKSQLDQMPEVQAIFYESDVPPAWAAYVSTNVDFFDGIGSPGGAAKFGVGGRDTELVAAVPVEHPSTS